MKRIWSRNVQRSLFLSFLFLPEFIFVSTVLYFFFFGIVDANTIYISSTDTYFGIFEFKSQFLVWFVWMVIGIVGAFIDWFFFRILLSPIALLVMNGDKEFFDEYREKHHDKLPFPNREQLNKNSSLIQEDPGVKGYVDSKPQISPKEEHLSTPFDWKCSCGHFNNEFSEVCEVCQKPKNCEDHDHCKQTIKEKNEFQENDASEKSKKNNHSNTEESINEKPKTQYDWKCSCGHYNDEFSEFCDFCLKPRKKT